MIPGPSTAPAMSANPTAFDMAERRRRLFDAALDLPPGMRAAMLREQCADDPHLLTELLELVALDQRLAGTTLESALPDLSQVLGGLEPGALSGRRVGPFALREELGRGGMGVVYRAERVDGELTQQVAIKFMRGEILGTDAHRRFLIERQTLARLEHPNIARLIDAARLEDGSPYIVMEFVAGTPITDYCDRLQLGVQQRLQLFQIVCNAVSSAHRNLIVHRDIKPGNLLVSADGTPKLLDFGIAKPLDDGALDARTGTAHRYFSPQYAAPEQMLGQAIGVGCDVYALGMLLYELLAGAGPFDFTGLSVGQVERLVTSVPPPPPSQTAAARGLDSARVRPLRGDLDGILLHCLRKSPAERYASVEQLETELANYLAGRPVKSRGGHRWYRLQKFVRRNAAATFAGALALLALLGGITAFAWQAQISRAQAQLATEQARIAEERAIELEAVSTLQADMLRMVNIDIGGRSLDAGVQEQASALLRGADPATPELSLQHRAFEAYWSRINAADVVRKVIVSAVLEPGEKAVRERFKDQERLAVRLLQQVAIVHAELGFHESSERLQREVLAARRRVLGNGHMDTLESMNLLATLLSERGHNAEAETYLRESLDLHLKLLGPTHVQTIEAHRILGFALLGTGKFEEAEAHFRVASETGISTLGADHRMVISASNNRAVALQALGRFAESEHLHRETLARRERLFGDNSPDTLTSRHNLGRVLLGSGRLEEASVLLELALRQRIVLLGQRDATTLSTQQQVASLKFAKGDLPAAEKMFRDSLQRRQEILGPQHPDTLTNMHWLAQLLWVRGELDEAGALARSAHQSRVGQLGEDHVATLNSRLLLAGLALSQDEPSRVHDLLQPEAAFLAAFPGDHGGVLATRLTRIGRAHMASGAFSKAEESLLKAAELAELHPMPFVQDRHELAQALVDLYDQWGAIPDAPRNLDSRAAPWRERLQALRSSSAEG